MFWSVDIRYWVEITLHRTYNLFERVLCENARKCLNVKRSPLKTRKSYWIPKDVLTNFIQSVVRVCKMKLSKALSLLRNAFDFFLTCKHLTDPWLFFGYYQTLYM